MQKLLLTSLTMLIGWTHSWPLYAQTVASARSLHRSSTTQGSQQEYESLQQVLSRIQSKHEVFLNYRTNLVENRRVATQSLDLEGQDLEQQLRRVLQPLELDFAKVKDNYYVIYQKGEAPPIVPVKRSKLSAADEPRLPRPQTLSAAPNDIQLALPQSLEKTITGRVTDLTDDSGLPGVNILAKGTTIGTVTDIDGNYRITVPDNTEVLVFSSVGYEAEEVTLGSQTVIDLAMSPDIQSLQEIVVIGYGEKERALLTESIGTVQAEELQKVPVASADQALQGRISGVQITSVDGTPGSPVSVRVRGVGTVRNAQPLFVVDGIPVGRNSGGITNPLATINPSDIESVSVLKDASAAAVYGVRAANGVVLITTKRGSEGAPKINFDGYFGIQRMPNLWETTNTAEYIGLTQEAYTNYNNQQGLADGDEGFLFLHPDLQEGGPYRDINSPWVDDVVNDNAPIQNYYLSVSGANDKARYFIAGGYFNQESTVKRWDLERFTFRANGDYKIGKRLRIGQTLTLSHQQVERGANGSGSGFVLRNAVEAPPFFRIYEDPNSPIPNNRYGFDGNFNVGGLAIPNSNAINQIQDRTERVTRFLGSVFGEVDIIEGLTFKTMMSADFSPQRNTRWQPAFSQAEIGLDRPVNNYTDTRVEVFGRVFTNTLTLDKTFGDHSINALVGLEYQKNTTSVLSYQGFDFISDDPNFYQDLDNAGGENSQLNASGASDNARVGYIGRVSYDYQNKYLVTGTVRRDGTSLFSPEDNLRWGIFPSVSAAWRISEEDFFVVPFITDLKVRGSWGQLGNDAGISYPHIFQISNTPDYGLNGDNTVAAPTPSSFVNQEVTWETVETIDAGVDVSMFNNKLDFMATYYQRTTKDFLIRRPIPPSVGFGDAPVNAGEVLNRGIELEVNYRHTFSSDFSFSVGANLTTVHNELVSLTDGLEQFRDPDGEYRTAIGRPIGYFYGYKTDGIYQNEAEAAAGYDADGNSIDAESPNGPQPGDIRFVDTNGAAAEDAPEGQLFSGETDGRIDDNDRTYLGKTIPDFFYGVNINANYKNWDLSMLFQGVEGVQLYNEVRDDGERLTGGGRNYLATVANRWTGPNTSNDMPRAVATDPNQNNRFSDRWVEDANFLRLRNIQLGYSLPKNLIDNFSLRVYVAASNLITITPYSGPDPEVVTYRENSDQLNAGTDQGNIPQPRTYQIGFQLQF